MSHIPERQEKDCLNCGTIVQGHYCQNCGQENVVPKETFWHMVTHFFYDITHFDSNFFHTIHHLILKPGFLSKEYMRGRRANYLHPIRMYVFTSAIFFLLFFTFFSPQANFISDSDKPMSPKERVGYLAALQERIKKDTSNLVLKEQLKKAKDSTQPLTMKDFNILADKDKGVIQFGNINYKSMAEYDSMERALPPSERDGWFMRRVTKKQIDINNKYRQNPEQAFEKMGDSLLHRLPYMLFISLPLFALILRLVYVRRKQFYFADHGVFTIHLYVFSFLILLAIFGLLALETATHLGFIEFIVVLLFLLLFFYLYMAMRNFYRQGWGKTFLKFLFISILSFIMMMVLFLFFIFFSAFTL
ncbi:MAG: DUF3667 domain-containing protein [Chitinophagaceae bacterium]